MISAPLLLQRQRVGGRTFQSKTFDFIYISTISVYEIVSGAKVAGRHSDINPFLPGLIIIDVNEEIAKEAASIYAELREKNRMIQGQDILIAGTARTHSLPLLTYNLSHFKHVPRLRAGSNIQAVMD